MNGFFHIPLGSYSLVLNAFFSYYKTFQCTQRLHFVLPFHWKTSLFPASVHVLTFCRSFLLRHCRTDLPSGTCWVWLHVPLRRFGIVDWYIANLDPYVQSVLLMAVPFPQLARKRRSPAVRSFGCSSPNRQLFVKIHQCRWLGKEIHV